MYKSKIIIDKDILEKIVDSKKMEEWEKNNFLKYIWYMTKKEQKELSLII